MEIANQRSFIKNNDRAYPLLFNTNCLLDSFTDVYGKGEANKFFRHFFENTIAKNAPESRKQVDIFILFQGHSENKLFELFTNMDLNISFDLFMQLYKNATEQPYSFLYVDKNKGEFRKNFNTRYVIT